MTDQRWTLRNIARRPIELHEAAEVSVLSADETIEVDAIGDHHTALITRGLMTAHPAPAPAAAASPASTAAAPARAARNRETPNKTSRRKGEGA